MGNSKKKTNEIIEKIEAEKEILATKKSYTYV